MGAITRSILGADPLQPAQELYQSANQVTEDIVTGVGKAAIGALDVVNQGNIAINKAVTPANALGPLDVRNYGVDLPDSVDKVLDTSYHDVRKRVVDYARSEHGEGWGIAADVLTPDAIDFVGGIGYWDNIAKGIGKVRKFAPEVPAAARRLTTTLDDMLSPQLQAVGAAGGVFEPSTVRRIIGTDDALAATALKHATDVKRVPLASRAGAVLNEQDALIKKLHPRKKGGDKLARDVLSGDNLTGDALELKTLILDQQKALASAPIAELADGTKIQVSSLSKAEIEALGVKIRGLKENLGLKSTSDYSNYTGAFVIDGYIARLDSKGKLVSTGQTAKRGLLEKLFPADESLFQDRYDISSRAGLTHKHHVRILEPSKVFGVVSDGKGGFAARDAGQLDRVTKRLRDSDNIHLGNQDLHEVMQSRLAHLGEKGDELSKYASHTQARTLTDLQGRTLADADFLQVVLKKGDGKPTWVKQVKNKEGIITDFKLRNGDSIKASNIKETLKYKLHGRHYDPAAVHGFSEEGIELLTNIKGDDDLYEAIKLFYQTTDEGFKGVAGVASKLIDKGKTADSLTKELLVQYSPEVQKWIKHMQTLPQFKNDRRLLDVMLQNNLDLYKLDLRKSYERPLKAFSKSNARRHLSINRN